MYRLINVFHAFVRQLRRRRADIRLPDGRKEPPADTPLPGGEAVPVSVLTVQHKSLNEPLIISIVVNEKGV